MAELNLNLAKPRRRFLGMGTYAPMQEKDWDSAPGFVSANYTEGDFLEGAYRLNSTALSQSNREDFNREVMSRFGILRFDINGGITPFEAPGGEYNTMSGNQASAVAELQKANGPFRILVAPMGSPSSVLGGGNQIIVTDGGGTPADTSAAMQFNATIANWQTMLESIDESLNALAAVGVHADYFGTHNETGIAPPALLHSTVIPSSIMPFFINRVWGGDGMTGGGIKQRWPNIKHLVFIDPVGALGLYRDEIIADSDANAEVKYSSLHDYSIIDLAEYGVTGSEPEWFGRTAVTEYGDFSSFPSAAEASQTFEAVQRAIVYGRVPYAIQWTSMRDVTEMGIADSRGVSYTAKPLADLDAGAGTYSLTLFWPATKALCLAAGRRECFSLVTPQDDPATTTSDADFDPDADTRLAHFERPDGTIGTAIWSDVAATHTLAVTSGGTTVNPRGARYRRLQTSDPDADSGWINVTVTGNSITLPSMNANDVLVVETLP